VEGVGEGLLILERLEVEAEGVVDADPPVGVSDLETLGVEDLLVHSSGFGLFLVGAASVVVLESDSTSSKRF
jgi:hypothetical protein